MFGDKLRSFEWLVMNGSPPRDMWIVRKFPLPNWNRVWKNLYASPVQDAIKSTWYKDLYDLIPTNDRLVAINLNVTSSFSSCGHLEPLQHRGAECGEGPIIWTWIKKILGFVLRVNHKHIPQDWTIRPAFQQWPTQKKAAVLWIWHTSCITAYRPTDVYLFRIIWNFCGGQGRRCTTKPTGPELQQISGCHRLAVNLRKWPRGEAVKPLLPYSSTCDEFNCNFVFHDLRTLFHNHTCLIFVPLLSTVTNRLY